MKAFGCHLSNEGMWEVEEWADFLGIGAVQVFLGAPIRLGLKKFRDGEVEQWLEWKRRSGCKLYIHGPYVLNFAENGQIGVRFVHCASQLLAMANELEAEATIFHCGTWKDRSFEEGLAIAVENLTKVHTRVPGRILIENLASPRDPKGNLNSIVQLVKELPASFGICFDTAHAYAAGYDVGDVRIVNNLQVLLDPYVGVVHLNDVAAKVTKGGGLDRHGNFERNATALLHLAKEWDCDMIIERGEGNNATDLDVLRTLGYF